MLFQSFEFQFFLVMTAVLYYAFRRQRLVLLAAANLLFYSVAGISSIFLFAGITFFTYICAMLVNKAFGRIALAAGLVVNLANLIFFKYTGFILASINTYLGIDFPWQDSLMAKLFLPLGISFYTFQMIAYLVDVRKGRILPERSFLTFWVFISFFSKVTAGPIMRGKDLLPQLHRLNEISFSMKNFNFFMYYMAMGLFKKIVFADHLAVLVGGYFSRAGTLSSLDAWAAAYLFAFQIYFDFSAYSEMAMGVGYLFGLELSINFKTPYLSKNPSEFWKRWHITLSSFIRDYIYIPLGGNKKGFAKQCVFLLIAMALSGLWHGSAWTFVIWGIYHGLLSVLHVSYIKLGGTLRERLKGNALYQLLCIFVLFQAVCIGWVFFRANSIHDALHMIKTMVLLTDINLNLSVVKKFGVVGLLFCLHIIENYVRNHENEIFRAWKQKVPDGIRGVVYAMIFVVIILITQVQESGFLYAQF